MKKFTTLCVTTLIGALAFLAPTAHADIITAADIFAIPFGVTGSGNGRLDIRMFTSETAENKQTGCGQNCWNGDDGNTSMPKGNGDVDTNSYIESYVTTAGKIKAFYDLQFGDGTAGSGEELINEMVVFLDLNEVDGDFAFNNHFELFDIVLNPATINGNPDPVNTDVASEIKNPNKSDEGTQIYIKHGYAPDSETQILASLDPNILTGGPTKYYNLPLIVQGAGFADYAIFTGINPYDLDATDVLLFNQSISFLSNGGETKFLSGEFGPEDLCPDCEAPPVNPVPEPATMLLLGTGLVGVAGAARRRKKKQV